MKILHFIVFLLCHSYQCNCEDSTNSTNKVHFTTSLWPFQSAIGLIGSLLNGFVLYIFIQDRESLTTSVNAMIW